MPREARTGAGVQILLAVAEASAQQGISDPAILGLIYGPGVPLAPQDYAPRTTQVIRYQAVGRFLPGRPWLGCDNEIPAEAR
jgi:hypothetical protein